MPRKKRLLSIYGFCLFIGIVIFFIFCLAPSFSLVENSSRLFENTEYIYYIDVSFDGKDEFLVMSNDTTTANVYSDYIYVQDRLPEELEFLGFVDTSDGTIGAVKRDESGTACGGYVVDGVSGLHYDNNTKVVSFQIYNLQAGCKVSVGIRVKTPYLPVNLSRMDFYNIAYGQEGNSTVASNTLHTYIGFDLPEMHTVHYEYVGDIPDGAPDLPSDAVYAIGSSVGLATEPVLSGYTFDGWTTTETVSDGVFTMPAQDVVVSGQFVRTPTYSVQYQIDGDMPDGYVVPDIKEYNEGSAVTIDSLQPGTEILGYRFLGWESTDAIVTNGNFIMPNTDVVFIGKFEKIVYTLSYEFRGVDIPIGAENLLPEPTSYAPGENVTLPVISTYGNYTFLGWNVQEPFQMPSQDTVIYGEWVLTPTFFPLKIERIVFNSQSYYHAGDVINMAIKIINPNDMVVSNVRVTDTEKVFLSNSNYEVLNPQNILIPAIDANQSITIAVRYTVTDTSLLAQITDTTTIVGATMGDGQQYQLDTNSNLSDIIAFSIANVSLEIIPLSVEDDNLSTIEFSLYEDEHCNTLLSQGLKFTRLLPNQTYYLKETKTQSGYVLLKDVLEVRVASDGTITIPNYLVFNQNEQATVEVYLQKINILPNTGGIGVIPFAIGGFSLIALSCGGYLFYLKKRRHKRK